MSEKGRIVIGLGTGRSGTASLSSLLNRQCDAVCFHEMNPSGAVFSGNPQAQLNVVTEFRRILDGGDPRCLSIDYSRKPSVDTYEALQNSRRVRLLGDIAFYYLSYVENILAVEPDCRFVCIQRDKAETVASWMRKSVVGRWPSLALADRIKALLTGTPFYREYNHWQIHDGSEFKPDPVWDSAFPKFEAPSKEAAIGQYWDYYYAHAERLEREFPERFRVFPVTALGAREGQQDILAFIGIEQAQMRLEGAVHLHQS